jgi:hypothetical protein
MSTFVLDEALEVIDGSSNSSEEEVSAEEEDAYNSEEIPVQTPVRKRGHGSVSSSGVQAHASGQKNFSRPRPRKKKRLAPLSSDSDTPTAAASQENEDSTDQPLTKDELILSEIKKSNKLLQSISKRVQKNEDRIKKVEKQHSSPASIAKSRRKKDVPAEVRVSYSFGKGGGVNVQIEISFTLGTQ